MTQNLQKKKPIRNKKYLDWVTTLDCCICGAPADDAHHIISAGQGGMGTKADDLYTLPLCRGHHTEIHNNPSLWESQWYWVAQTLREAVKQGVLVFDNEAMK